MQFLAYTKTAQYKASLQQLLDQEKVSPGLCPHLCPLEGALVLGEAVVPLWAVHGSSGLQKGCGVLLLTTKAWGFA